MPVDARARVTLVANLSGTAAFTETIDHVAQGATDSDLDFASGVERVLPALEAADIAATVTTLQGPIVLDDYLVTRCVEAVVHGCDFADPVEPDPGARCGNRRGFLHPRGSRSVGPVPLTVDDIVARLRDAIAEHTPPLAVRDVLDELVADPSALDAAVGPVELGGITTLHNSADLTVLRVAWTPGMVLNPHEHRMWAAIGMYGGQEDNAFYRRSPAGLDPSGGKAVTAGDVLVLGDDVIHSVANTRREFAVALHVYGGDFFTGARSEWDFDTFGERPRDLDRTRRLFAEANARWLEAPG